MLNLRCRYSNICSTVNPAEDNFYGTVKLRRRMRITWHARRLNIQYTIRIRLYRYVIIVVKSKNSMKNYCIVSHYLLLRRAPYSRSCQREIWSCFFIHFLCIKRIHLWKVIFFSGYFLWKKILHDKIDYNN